MDEMNRWKWRRRLERISIPNLMTYIVAGMGALYLLQLFVPSINVYGLLSLTRSGLMRGELWRIVTFVFLPPSSSLFWIVFTLYFYWLIGSTLSNQWGSSRFTLFYLTGILGNVISALITGSAGNTFLNLSLFFAFAIMNPDFQMMIFFFLPIKIKYLAILDAALYVWQLIVGGWSTRLMILFSLLNLILFLGGDFINTVRREAGYFKTRYNFKKAMRGR